MVAPVDSATTTRTTMETTIVRMTRTTLMRIRSTSEEKEERSILTTIEDKEEGSRQGSQPHYIHRPTRTMTLRRARKRRITQTM